MNRTLFYGIAGAALLISAFFILSLISDKASGVQGSVNVGNDYPYATSTRGYTGTALTNYTVIKNGPGTLSRVVITGANTGIVRIWDATTTNVTLRAASDATSTLKYVEFPASAAANDYDFDVEFNDGILYELVSGLAPTSTIVTR